MDIYYSKKNNNMLYVSQTNFFPHVYEKFTRMKYLEQKGKEMAIQISWRSWKEENSIVSNFFFFFLDCDIKGRGHHNGSPITEFNKFNRRKE